MKQEMMHRLKVVVLSNLAAGAIRLWRLTLRIHEHDLHWKQEVEESGHPMVGTCWHYSLLSVFMVSTTSPMVLMISASKDGDYLAELAQKMGFLTVRGSSNNRGMLAARGLIRSIRQGNAAALVADGSQGPARVAQAGPLVLAAKTGGLVLPIVYSASRYFRFNTWDSFILPKPFSRVDIHYAQPIELSSSAAVSDIKVHRWELEKSLNTIYAKAWKRYGKLSH